MADTSGGLTCPDHGFQQWRELSYRVIGDEWIWSCGVCRQRLGAHPWDPPPDMPAFDPEYKFLKVVDDLIPHQHFLSKGTCWCGCRHTEAETDALNS